MVLGVGCRSEVDWFCSLGGLCGLIKLWGSHSAWQSVLVAGMRQIGLVVKYFWLMFSISYYSSHSKELRSGWSVWFAQIVGITQCISVSVVCRSKADGFSGQHYQRIFWISLYSSHAKELCKPPRQIEINWFVFSIPISIYFILVSAGRSCDTWEL